MRMGNINFAAGRPEASGYSVEPGIMQVIWMQVPATRAPAEALRVNLLERARACRKQVRPQSLTAELRCRREDKGDDHGHALTSMGLPVAAFLEARARSGEGGCDTDRSRQET